MGKMSKILTIVLFSFSVSKVIGFKFKDFHINEIGLLPMCFTERAHIKITNQELGTARVLLFTSQHNYTAYPLQEMSLLLSDVNFNPTLNSMIYIHGFLQNATDPKSKMISDVFLLTRNYNVLLLDLCSLFSLNFFRSVMAVTRVGETLGTQLNILKELGCTMAKLIVIGHSLGAHTAGFAGKQFFKLSGKKLPMIIGLDPAGPCYGAVPGQNRLDKSDAVFVQAIHTNAGGLGMMRPVGHADFYFNGGRLQPTCPKILDIILNAIYSHERSIKLMYFATMYPASFVGVECRSVEDVDLRFCNGKRTAVFGLLANPLVQGIFYIKTSDHPPFFEDTVSNNDDGQKQLVYN